MRVQRTRSSPRFRWRCCRCARDNDAEVRDGWTHGAYVMCQCGRPVDLFVRRELDGRVVRVERPETA